jgi:hypothetical protein
MRNQRRANDNTPIVTVNNANANNSNNNNQQQNNRQSENNLAVVLVSTL